MCSDCEICVIPQIDFSDVLECKPQTDILSDDWSSYTNYQIYSDEIFERKSRKGMFERYTEEGIEVTDNVVIEEELKKKIDPSTYVLLGDELPSVGIPNKLYIIPTKCGFDEYFWNEDEWVHVDSICGGDDGWY